MERDKLNKAAESAAHDYDNSQFDSFDDYVNGFLGGAEWLMAQPLSERLTEEEVEKLNGIVFLMRGLAAYNRMSYDCLKRISTALYDIFGKDIFIERQRNCAVVNMDMLRQRNV